MPENQWEVLASRRHPKIVEKLDIWNLLSESYEGGLRYIKSSNLFRHPKEGSKEYAVRKSRSVFFNHVQPIADVLAGFIFSTQPQRTIPAEISFANENISKGKALASYMLNVAIQSQLFTCGTLVDSPSFKADEIKTEKDRKEKNLNPYCVFYYPTQIRDFYLDDRGELEWILLDDSYLDSKDPLSPASEVIQYTLWTKQYFTKIKKVKLDKGEKKEEWQVVASQKPHSIGKVPFVFHNFRDNNEDMVTETPFEDIALLDRAIYNNLSLLDEMLHSGTFKMLFVPVEKENDIPTSVIESGVGGLSVFPYNGKLSSSPEFKGAGLEDVQSFSVAINMYLKEIFSKVGLDKDQERAYVQSGIAKKMEYKKAEAFLRHGAAQLESAEKQILYFLGKWLDKDFKDIKVDYQKNFNEDEINETLSRLYEVMNLPISSIQQKAEEEIIRKVFSFLDSKEVEELLNSYRAEKEAKAKTTNGSAGIESSAIEEEAKARLKGTVGGVDGILSIQEKVSSGITDYDAAVEILREIYGFTDEKAKAILGTPIKKTNMDLNKNTNNQTQGDEQSA